MKKPKFGMCFSLNTNEERLAAFALYQEAFGAKKNLGRHTPRRNRYSHNNEYLWN